jgi:large subunit ribosomal protein L6
MPKAVKVGTPVQTRSSSRASTSRPSARSPRKSARYRPPEPYKGKGVRYVDERVIIKETKKK